MKQLRRILPAGAQPSGVLQTADCPLDLPSPFVPPQRVAIAITCFNQSSYTKRAVQSLCDTTPNVDSYDFTFAIFDDCSTDDTKDIANSMDSGKLSYWCSGRNRGVTYLWNAAYRQYSKWDYIAIVNNDVIFTPYWCHRILDIMRDRKCVMAGPITNGPGHVGEQDVRRYVRDYVPSDDWDGLLKLSSNIQHLEPFEVKKINGFCMVFDLAFLRNAQMDRIGEPFDPRNRNFGNEDEIQTRLDPRPLVIPSSFVFHYKRVTFQSRRPRNFTQYRPLEPRPFELE